MDKVAIYCRLSKEDYDKIKKEDESESITNQRIMLTDYALSHGFSIVDTYIDDDYSGLYLDRPGFERLLYDAKLQMFNIVLAKSQSRFTRNMEHVEKYLHHDFPLLGIRFIGVVDCIDTSVKSNKKVRQINGLINEWYSEDLSDNIKAVFREKMKNGQFIGSFACYGYIKDPLDHHRIVIDEEAATIVKLIYKLCLEGYGATAIAKKLTDLKIKTPTVYKQQRGLKFYNPNSSSFTSVYGIWSTTTIKKILNNETYTGTLIQGREKKVSYKSRKIITAPKEEWVTIPNNHEPIISSRLFDEVQQLLHQRRKSCNNQLMNPHLLAGKVKCADCESTMVKTSGKSCGGQEYLICQLSRKTNNLICTRHSIRFDELMEVIADRINRLLGDYTTYHLENLLQELPSINNKKIVQNLSYGISLHEAELTDLSNSISVLYLDKTKGILSESEFLAIKKTLSDKIKELNEILVTRKEELEHISSSEQQNQGYLNILQQYLHFENNPFELIHSFVSCIYIGEKSENSQTIEIRWNF
jgi:DNA invertase Pin-like site-specific DNA recombinase